MITLKIPCKSYVRKYLIARYGLNHTITKQSLLGMMVHEKLSKNYNPADYIRRSGDVYEVVLTDWCFRNVGHSIDIPTLNALGSAMYYLFREDLYLYVRQQLAKGEKATTAIKEFLQMFDITEDELKFETVYRDYKRKHASIKSDKHKKNLSTP